MARDLALKHGFNARKAFLAGVYHDLTKQWTLEQHETYLRKYLPLMLLEPIPTWHAATAALYLKYHFKYTDREILSAIRKHTTGSPIMNALDKIVFIADKISRERNYEGVNSLRLLAFKDFNQAFIEIFKRHYKEVNKTNQSQDIGQQIKTTYQKFIK